MVNSLIFRFLVRWGKRLFGAVLLICGLFSAAASISYSPFDPSINHATNSSVNNWCGLLGAYIADPVMQAFGYGALLISVIMVFYGNGVLLDKQMRYAWLRISIAILLLPFVTLFLAVIGDGTNSYNNGGYLGYFLLQEFSPFLSRRLVFFITLVLTCFAYMAAIGLSIKQWIRFMMLLIKQIRNLFLLVLWGVRFLYIWTRKSIPQSVEHDSQERLEMPKMLDPIIEVSPKTRASSAKEPVQPTLKLDLDEFSLPPTSLLRNTPVIAKRTVVNEGALSQNSKLLQQVLQDFGINGKLVKIHPGPVVTLYELEPAAGTKSSRVIGLSDDIARSMSAVSARIAVMPGKNALGIELPNSFRETVYLRELLETKQYKQYHGQLPLVLGKNIAGEPVIADLTKMPHLLVAGTTGSGKSVAINTMILSLLYKYTPQQCQLIMIDPKMLELSVYEGIPHLVAPVVTEAKKAVTALKWVVKEMEKRYRSMSALGVRNIQGYNKAIEEAQSRNTRLMKEVQTGFDRDTGKPKFESVELHSELLPHIVVIVDEMADLMIVSGKEIESSIQRLAQMARAAGIHIIMATQRPSVDVITGVIKANFPTRISFQVTSKIDSRTILGEQGAEQLLGMGDMLYMAGGGRIERVHGPFVSDKEVEEVVMYLKEHGGEPLYKQDITADDDSDEEGNEALESTGDDLYDQAVKIVLSERRPTTSYIQRCLKIGYNRAANLIEKMEKNGIVSAPNSLGKRDVLIEGDN